MSTPICHCHDNPEYATRFGSDQSLRIPPLLWMDPSTLLEAAEHPSQGCGDYHGNSSQSPRVSADVIFQSIDL